MTDIHSHIIYGVDDGSKTIEESIELLSNLKRVGFDNVIMTPHYIEGASYASTNDEKLEKLANLREAVKKAGIDIGLYLGNEVFVNDHMLEGIKANKIYTLNGTKYLLFELPFHNQIIGLSDMVYEIKIQGYVPILAHPERYSYFQDNYDLVDELREDGLLFQANYSSILGGYGKSAQKLVKYMLKKRYIDYLGTDLHHMSKGFVIDNFKKIEKALMKVCGKDYYHEIIQNGDELVK